MRNPTYWDKASRDGIVASFAQWFVRMEQTNENATLTSQAAFNGYEAACSGRTNDAARKAWKRAVSKARRQASR